MQGIEGPVGPQGPRGETGPQGIQGVQGVQGIQGETGPANTLTIGTVTKGDEAGASISGDAPNQTLNLILPKGDKGEVGVTEIIGTLEMPVDLSTLSTGTYNIKGLALISEYNTLNAGEGMLMQVSINENYKSVAYLGGFFVYEKNGNTYEYVSGDAFETTDYKVGEINAEYASGQYPTVEAVYKALNSRYYGTKIVDDTLAADTPISYDELPDDGFVSKGSLENAITDKGLVSNTDYASSSKGGVIKTETGLGTYLNANGTINASTRTYAQYNSANNELFIGKGTLENVLNTRIGDIDSVLDAINGEVI